MSEVHLFLVTYTKLRRILGERKCVSRNERQSADRVNEEAMLFPRENVLCVIV